MVQLVPLLITRFKAEVLTTSTLNTAPATLKGAKAALAAIFAPVSRVMLPLIRAIPFDMSAAVNVVPDVATLSKLITISFPPLVDII